MGTAYSVVALVLFGFTCSGSLPTAAPSCKMAFALARWRTPQNRNYRLQEQQKPTEPSADLLDYFDPRISPHKYPNGIDSSIKRKNSNQKLPEQAKPAYESKALPLEFDPTLSPHDYPMGVDAGPLIQDSSSADDIIGILLIDHGSRRESSNQQLHLLAERYQQRLSSNFKVYAAHMEIASPTIPQAIQAMAQIPRITKIICHPYFLSPGRHVTEDVPRIIAEAVHTIQDTVVFTHPDSSEFDSSSSSFSHTKIQLYLTDALGSDMDSIIPIIDEQIQQTLARVIVD